MLQQGKAVIDEFKGETEGLVNQVKETVETVTGIWEWAKGLWESLTGQPKKPAPAVVDAAASVAPVAQTKKTKKQPQPELTYEEYKAKSIHDVCEQLKVFFEAQRQLKQHCRELEEQSLTTEKIADSAIDRIEIETQLISLSTQIREAMSWTPESLGLQDMYKRFLQMYDLILEEQEFDRQMKLRKARIEEAKKWQLRNSRIDRLLSILGVTLMTIWIWGLLFGLIWQQKMQTDFWLD